MQVIEQLQHFTESLNRPRDANAWYQFLLTLIDELFIQTADDHFQTVITAIESFIEYCQHADFKDEISLNVVREFLTHHFSQPDPGRQFMVGQVTFCSMLPMRSIPFKIVAVLGLNEGEYPRQRVNVGFDLMSLSDSRIGDRSRRGDDRYLFLEAIISARKSLYLSYQGRSIKNNKDRQPSIVLKELMDYLEQGYGWNLYAKDKLNIRQLAMQPYSDKKTILASMQVFDKKVVSVYLLRGKSNAESRHEKFVIADSIFPQLIMIRLNLSDEYTVDIALTIEEVVRFFQHPARAFAQKKLKLYLDDSNEALNDIEPFDSDHLSRYLF